MKSKIVTVLIASFPLVVFADVTPARKTWVNSLFKVYPPVGAGPFVELKEGSLMIVQGNATRTSKDNGKTWSGVAPDNLRRAGTGDSVNGADGKDSPRRDCNGVPGREHPSLGMGYIQG